MDGKEANMKSFFLLNGNRVKIGLYAVQFVNSELVVTIADDPSLVGLRLAGDDALDFIDYLALHRGSLFAAVMRDDVEALKAHIRAEYALPAQEETRVYVPPSSCDETLIALAQAGGAMLCCDECQTPLCMDCYNCHNSQCRRHCEQLISHLLEHWGL